MSAVSDFFESAPFGNYRKEREGMVKLSNANISRLDNIVKAIGSLGKMLAKRGM